MRRPFFSRPIFAGESTKPYYFFYLKISTNQAAQEKQNVTILVDRVLAKRPLPKNIEVTIALPSGLPPMYVDPHQTKQVLDNLIANGYQAMPEGGSLTIHAQAEEEQVSLSIADTGCGISQENMERVFEPLFTTKARGIGLGLAISKNLVEANGGSIRVESDGVPGKGSTFRVILPTLTMLSYGHILAQKSM